MIRRSLSRLKRSLRYRLRYRRLHAAWKKRHATVFSANPPYRRKLSPGVEAEHKKLWQDLVPSVPMETLRICAAISGTADSRIIPEEIFPLVIEPTLNNWHEADFLAHKSVYNRWFPDTRFPRCYLHCFDGVYYDHEYNQVAKSDVLPILDHLSYPVVLKPSWGSYGGKGVVFSETREALVSTMANARDYVIQELIQQHAFFSQFNIFGLNTVRLCLYRSIVSGQVFVLNMALRMGVGGSLDNETAGGIVCYVTPEGILNSYAVNKYGMKVSSHPDTHVSFATASRLPKIRALRTLAIDTATRLLGARLVSLDMCMDTNGQWRVLEINLFGQTIRFSQYAGVPFFGEHTEEVIEHCKRFARR